ncbi:MAG: hypothetical protein WC625_07770 [Caldisericia bacterium]
MEEARRFFRYIIPGLLFFIEISLYLFFSANNQFIQFLREWGKDISFSVTLFLTSGGMGFLLGVVYHTLYWTKGIRRLVVNHVPLIKDCVKRGWLELARRRDGSNINISTLTQSGAWRIVIAFWHERRECSKRIKAANARTDSLTDIMHGLGVTLVGSLLSIPIWVCIHAKLVCTYPSWYYYLPPVLISSLHFVNYRRVIKDFQSIVDIIISNEIKNEYDKNNAPVIMHLSSIDYSDRAQKKNLNA